MQLPPQTQATVAANREPNQIFAFMSFTAGSIIGRMVARRGHQERIERVDDEERAVEGEGVSGEADDGWADEARGARCSREAGVLNRREFGRGSIS